MLCIQLGKEIGNYIKRSAWGTVKTTIPNQCSVSKEQTNGCKRKGSKCY